MCDYCNVIRVENSDAFLGNVFEEQGFAKELFRDEVIPNPNSKWLRQVVPVKKRRPGVIWSYAGL